MCNKKNETLLESTLQSNVVPQALLTSELSIAHSVCADLCLKPDWLLAHVCESLRRRRSDCELSAKLSTQAGCFLSPGIGQQLDFADGHRRLTVFSVFSAGGGKGRSWRWKELLRLPPISQCAELALSIGACIPVGLTCQCIFKAPCVNACFTVCFPSREGIPESVPETAYWKETL